MMKTGAPSAAAAAQRVAWGSALLAGVLTVLAPVMYVFDEGAPLMLGLSAAVVGVCGAAMALRSKDLRLAMLNLAVGSLVLVTVAIVLTIAGGP